MSGGRDRRRVERVKKVRQLQADISLAALRHARLALAEAEQARVAAGDELDSRAAASSAAGMLPAGGFAQLRAGLDAQARLVVLRGEEVVVASDVADVARGEWSELARRVEGLERLVDRIRDEELAADMNAERALLDEFSVSRIARGGGR